VHPPRFDVTFLHGLGGSYGWLSVLTESVVFQDENGKSFVLPLNQVQEVGRSRGDVKFHIRLRDGHNYNFASIRVEGDGTVEETKAGPVVDAINRALKIN
jgi:hypothetical protein